MSAVAPAGVEMLGRRPSGRIMLVADRRLGQELAAHGGCAVAVADELERAARRLRAAWPCLDLLLVCQQGQPQEQAQRAAEAVGGVLVAVAPGFALEPAQAHASSTAGAAA